MRHVLFAALLAVAAPASAQSRADAIRDSDTRAWWRIAEHLSSDAMEGRDVGSPGHDRAGRWVAERFRAAGLKPAGENGTFFQTFPVHEAKVEAASVTVAGADGRETTLRFLHDFTVRAADDLAPTIDAPLVFAGYCRPEDLGSARGKVAICFNTRRTGLTSSADRVRNAQAAGAVGLIQVDDPYFTIEPPRWPAAYARTVTAKAAPAAPSGGFVVMTLNAEALAKVLAGSGQDAAALLKAGGTKQAVAAFDIPARLKASFRVSGRDFTATNVLAVLPGADPKLAAEHVVLSAHLDGYGYGEPVAGDGLYNGTLDNAAYVGTLIRFAERRRGRPLKRSVLLAAFTGEEKGLLGAYAFTRNPTVPKTGLVANINLDQLRPLYPLTLLTVHALDDTSLGSTVRAIATRRGVRVQADPEPERGLVARSDNWPFMRIGVPATGFIFGYEPGTEAEARYREWYQVRYHRPQDDATQPMDFQAAGDFNRLVYELVETVADAPERPTWNPASPYVPAP